MLKKFPVWSISEGGAEVDNVGLQFLTIPQGARTLMPDFPGIHMALSREYARNALDPERAIKEGVLAVKFDPNDLAVRANLGMIFLSLGRLDEARQIGEQLTRLAVSKYEKGVAASYQAQLEQFVDSCDAQAKAAVPDSGAPALVSPTSPTDPGNQPGIKPLKFWLPDRLSALGTEVRTAVMQGRLDDAIKMVKNAIPTAKGQYEQQSLKSLLAHLKARKAGY